jgi:hypothetical protein
VVSKVQDSNEQSSKEWWTFEVNNIAWGRYRCIRDVMRAVEGHQNRILRRAQAGCNATRGRNWHYCGYVTMHYLFSYCLPRKLTRAADCTARALDALHRTINDCLVTPRQIGCLQCLICTYCVCVEILEIVASYVQLIGIRGTRAEDCRRRAEQRGTVNREGACWSHALLFLF